MTGRVLVTGGTGLLGSTLAPELAALGFEVVVHGHRSPAQERADLARAGEAEGLVRRVAPSTVVNLVALSDVDACQLDGARAYLANVETVRRLAAACRAVGAGLVHVSTDQVYSAAGDSTEEDALPVNTYGLSKLAGDEVALAAGATVLRTNFIGASRRPGRASQSDWYLAALRARKPIVLFTDIRFAPLRMETVARAVAAVLERPVPGLFNLGARGGMSKRDFAHRLARRFGLDLSHAPDGRSDQIATRAPRPQDTCMDVRRFVARFGLELPTLEDEIAALAEGGVPP